MLVSIRVHSGIGLEVEGDLDKGITHVKGFNPRSQRHRVGSFNGAVICALDDLFQSAFTAA